MLEGRRDPFGRMASIVTLLLLKRLAKSSLSVFHVVNTDPARLIRNNASRQADDRNLS